MEPDVATQGTSTVRSELIHYILQTMFQYELFFVNVENNDSGDINIKDLNCCLNIQILQTFL